MSDMNGALQIFLGRKLIKLQIVETHVPSVCFSEKIYIVCVTSEKKYNIFSLYTISLSSFICLVVVSQGSWVRCLGGLSLPRNSVVRLADRPDMTLDVYRGRKTTIQ